jgi:hypothetical protein
MEFRAHPAAAIFPLMEGKDFDDLVADIEKNGLRERIVYRISDGMIETIDGRNRERALSKLGRELLSGGEPNPAYFRLFDAEKDGDITAFIISVNIRRRHLTETQKREAVVRLLQVHPEKSSRKIAAMADVSHATVARVRKSSVSRDTLKRQRPTRTQAEQGRKQVRTLLKENPSTSNACIADAVGCSDMFVARIREQLVATGKLAPVTEVTRRDGRRSPVKPVVTDAAPAKPVIASDAERKWEAVPVAAAYAAAMECEAAKMAEPTPAVTPEPRPEPAPRKRQRAITIQEEHTALVAALTEALWHLSMDGFRRYRDDANAMKLIQALIDFAAREGFVAGKAPGKANGAAS